MEPTAVLHSVEELVPLKMEWVKYEGRKVLSMEFRAFDCYFMPSGRVAVNGHRQHQVPCFEQRDVLEIRKSETGVEKNRLLCPSCHYASLKVANELSIVGTRQVRHDTACTRKGCDGTSNYTD